jgi:flagellar protein FliO/FliZ
MNSLFGLELPTPVNFVIAFVVVLVLIGAATWLVRRFGVTRLDPAARGRQPRLAVIDSAAVDGRRKLVMIRRDNVEHLLMIGGPTDVVVETNIVRAAAAGTRDIAVGRNGGAEAMSRGMMTPEPWPLQPEPVVSMRPDRAPRVVADDPSQWQAPAEPTLAPAQPLRADHTADPLAGLAAELSQSDTEPTTAPRAVPAEPTPAAAPQPAPSAQQAAPGADQSLAEMAQRLEAALRRPAMQKVAAEGGTARIAINTDSRTADSRPARPAPKVAVAGRGGAEPKSQSQPQSQSQSANLEQEMASLLHRPGKT